MPIIIALRTSGRTEKYRCWIWKLDKSSHSAGTNKTNGSVRSKDDSRIQKWAF